MTRCKPALAAILLGAAVLLAACSASASPAPATNLFGSRLVPPYNPAASVEGLPGRRTAPPTAEPLAVATAVPPASVAPERLNIVLLGADERETWSEGPPRTDAIMVVSADRGTKSVQVVSIPRDLWVGIPGFGQERINVAYRVAELYEPGSGPDTAGETVSAFLGIPVAKYVVVNFRAVREIVDALGGLEVNIPYEIWDFQYPTEDNQFMTVHFSPGLQILNGEQVLQYIRTRHGSSDFDRMRRQQQVIEAVRARVTRADFIPKAPGFLLLARDCVRTNLSVSEMVSLWSSFRDIGGNDVTLSVIDETYTYPWITGAGAEVLLPNDAAIQGLVHDLGLAQVGPSTPLARGLQIRLYAAGAQDPNFAAATQALAAADITVWEGGVAENPCGHTVILDYGDGQAGLQVAEVLGLDSISVLRLPRPPAVPREIEVDVMLWTSGSGNQS